MCYRRIIEQYSTQTEAALNPQQKVDITLGPLGKNANITDINYVPPHMYNILSSCYPT